MKIMNPAQDVYADIVSLKIQGATNVALAVLTALDRAMSDEPELPADRLKELGNKLAYARPTEPLAQNALRYIFADTPKNAAALKAKIATYTSYIHDATKKIAEYGNGIVADGKTYLTHCHASTVTNIFLEAKKSGKNFSVIATETRPRFQGRLTTKELLDGGITDVTMVVDSAAASLLADTKRNIAGIFVGADLLTDQGLVNKIGTHAILLAAKTYGIPVYCISTLLKYDPRPFSPDLIETRDPKEVWAEAPSNLTIFSPAFDYTPYSDGVTIVTEAGMIKGSEVKETALTNYPFIHL
jgi:ribose 1,5-bisphosphate isomerase